MVAPNASLHPAARSTARRKKITEQMALFRRRVLLSSGRADASKVAFFSAVEALVVGGRTTFRTLASKVTSLATVVAGAGAGTSTPFHRALTGKVARAIAVVAVPSSSASSSSGALPTVAIVVVVVVTVGTNIVGAAIVMSVA